MIIMTDRDMMIHAEKQPPHHLRLVISLGEIAVSVSRCETDFLLEGPSTRPRLIYSSGLVGSFGERDGGADVAEVT